MPMANSAAISDTCLVMVIFPYFLPAMEMEDVSKRKERGEVFQKDGRMKEGEERQQENAEVMEDERRGTL